MLSDALPASIALAAKDSLQEREERSWHFIALLPVLQLFEDFWCKRPLAVASLDRTGFSGYGQAPLIGRRQLIVSDQGYLPDPI